MKEYITGAQINAPVDRVWRVLTDAQAYAEWNPEILGVQGRFGRAERIKVRVKVKAGGGKTAVRTVPMRITAFDPPSQQRAGGTMEWVGGLPFGLFVGRRTFTARPGTGGTVFRMVLVMSGPLSGPILKSVGDRQPEIDSFSAALKSRTERV